ncbi:MAG: hypothetical protein WBW98_13085 [Candidatus Sulfotelmatobacter sp.]
MQATTGPESFRYQLGSGNELGGTSGGSANVLATKQSVPAALQIALGVD